MRFITQCPNVKSLRNKPVVLTEDLTQTQGDVRPLNDVEYNSGKVHNLDATNAGVTHRDEHLVALAN